VIVRAEDMSLSVSEDTVNYTSEDMSQNIPENTPGIPENIPENTPGIPENIPENTDEGKPWYISEDLSEDMLEDLSGDILEENTDEYKPWYISEDTVEIISSERPTRGVNEVGLSPIKPKPESIE
ncbi:MAG: hypothetical protein PHW56_08440, partial [Methanosarcinaceae archaeon]|nr:hypothetical protein [Methanosarcinaceae archaeon]